MSDNANDCFTTTEVLRPKMLLNELGSADIFYRAQQPRSGTTPPNLPHSGFIAGDPDCAASFQDLPVEDQRKIVEDHSIWGLMKPSPFVSLTKCLDNALDLAEVMTDHKQWYSPSSIANLPVHIAVIRPGRVPTGTMRYYHWNTLVHDLGASISNKARNPNEYEFLGSIPAETIVEYFPYDPTMEANEIRKRIEDGGENLILLVVGVKLMRIS
jgi:hypothetical protein